MSNAKTLPEQKSWTAELWAAALAETLGFFELKPRSLVFTVTIGAIGAAVSVMISKPSATRGEIVAAVLNWATPTVAFLTLAFGLLFCISFFWRAPRAINRSLRDELTERKRADMSLVFDPTDKVCLGNGSNGHPRICLGIINHTRQRINGVSASIRLVEPHQWLDSVGDSAWNVTLKEAGSGLTDFDVDSILSNTRPSTYIELLWHGNGPSGAPVGMLGQVFSIPDDVRALRLRVHLSADQPAYPLEIDVRVTASGVWEVGRFSVVSDLSAWDRHPPETKLVS